MCSQLASDAKHPHVLLVAHGLDNVGERARLYGVLKSLLESAPDAKITIVCRYKQDQSSIQSYILCHKLGNIEVKRHPWLIEARWMLLTAMLSSMLMVLWFFIATIRCGLWHITGGRVHRIYDKYDVVIDLSFADFSDANLGCILGGILALSNLSYALMNQKPVITCSASIRGLYNFFWRNIFHIWCNLTLNRLQLIIVRDKASYTILRNMGITKAKMDICPDFAFLGFSVAKIDLIAGGYLERQVDDKPLIAIIPRQKEGIYRRHVRRDKEARFVAKLGDLFIERFGARVVLIPFSIGSFYDDVALCHIAHKQMRCAEEASVFDSCRISEIGEVMSQCALCISFRLHGSVAASCWGVPSVTVASISSPKFREVIGYAIGQEVIPIIDINKVSDQEEQLNIIETYASKIWGQREYIRQVLLEKMESIRSEILSAGKQIIRCISDGQRDKG